MERGTKIGIAVAAGVVAVGGGIAYAATRRPPATTPSAQKTTSNTGTAAYVFAQSSVSATAAVGQVATFDVQVTNLGAVSGVPNITGTTSLGGVTEGKIITASSAGSIGPGETAAVPLQTAGPIASIFGGKALAVYLTLALGPEGVGMQTITGVLTVAATPASFQFVNSSGSAVSSLGSIGVKPGQYWSATVFVKNVGGTAAVPKFSGTESLNGTTEGSIVSPFSGSVAAGAVSSGITVQSAGPISSEFQGRQLALSLTVTP